VRYALTSVYSRLLLAIPSQTCELSSAKSKVLTKHDNDKGKYLINGSGVHIV